MAVVTLDAKTHGVRYFNFLRKEDISQGYYVQLHWVLVVKTTGRCVNMEELSSQALFLRPPSENELQTTKWCLNMLRPSNEIQGDRIACHSKPAVTICLHTSAHVYLYTHTCVYTCIQGKGV